MMGWMREYATFPRGHPQWSRELGEWRSPPKMEGERHSPIIWPLRLVWLITITRIWTDAQCDGCPAEYRWRLCWTPQSLRKIAVLWLTHDRKWCYKRINELILRCRHQPVACRLTEVCYAMFVNMMHAVRFYIINTTVIYEFTAL